MPFSVRIYTNHSSTRKIPFLYTTVILCTVSVILIRILYKFMKYKKKNSFFFMHLHAISIYIEWKCKRCWFKWLNWIDGYHFTIVWNYMFLTFYVARWFELQTLIMILILILFTLTTYKNETKNEKKKIPKIKPYWVRAYRFCESYGWKGKGMKNPNIFSPTKMRLLMMCWVSVSVSVFQHHVFILYKKKKSRFRSHSRLPLLVVVVVIFCVYGKEYSLMGSKFVFRVFDRSIHLMFVWIALSNGMDAKRVAIKYASHIICIYYSYIVFYIHFIYIVLNRKQHQALLRFINDIKWSVYLWRLNWTLWKFYPPKTKNTHNIESKTIIICA